MSAALNPCTGVHVGLPRPFRVVRVLAKRL